MCMVAGERRNAIEGVGEKKRDGDQKEMDRQYRKSIVVQIIEEYQFISLITKLVYVIGCVHSLLCVGAKQSCIGECVHL